MKKGNFGTVIPENYDELVSMTVLLYLKERPPLATLVDIALDRGFTHEYGIKLVKAAGKTEKEFENDVREAIKDIK